MRNRKTKPSPVVTVPELPWGYPQLARHLGVSVRTLKRYVVSGSVPTPTLVLNRSRWEGTSLIAARGGPQIPGTFDYTPNPRERLRIETVERNRRRREEEEAHKAAAGKKAAARRKAGAK